MPLLGFKFNLIRIVKGIVRGTIVCIATMYGSEYHCTIFSAAAITVGGPGKVHAPVRATLPNVGRNVAPHTAEGATSRRFLYQWQRYQSCNGCRCRAGGWSVRTLLQIPRVLVCPPNHISSIASSPIDNFAINTAPASFSCWYTNASSSITWSLNGGVP
jgi:hypothetical protein